MSGLYSLFQIYRHMIPQQVGNGKTVIATVPEMVKRLHLHFNRKIKENNHWVPDSDRRMSFALRQREGDARMWSTKSFRKKFFCHQNPGGMGGG